MGHYKYKCWSKVDSEGNKLNPSTGVQKPKSNLKCNYCGKTGHIENDCYSKKKAKGKSDAAPPKPKI